MEDRRTKPPLLYIDQKQNSSPEVSSQSFYYSAQQQSKEKNNVRAAKESSRSRFQSLSTHEKVNYILNLQETLPALKCKVMTKQGTFTGVIEERKDDTVSLIVTELPRRRIIKTEDLLDIQIVGF
ncbi:CotO family spore coat protein [Piscibacillus sp. B03]|uniref:CotO family spore coat protein n=1 Tax=Piscibacillus sp. B03 TaxID=3457430 RepID=UPI003FCDD447